MFDEARCRCCRQFSARGNALIRVAHDGTPRYCAAQTPQKMMPRQRYATARVNDAHRPPRSVSMARLIAARNAAHERGKQRFSVLRADKTAPENALPKARQRRVPPLRACQSGMRKQIRRRSADVGVAADCPRHCLLAAAVPLSLIERVLWQVSICDKTRTVDFMMAVPDRREPLCAPCRHSTNDALPAYVCRQRAAQRLIAANAVCRTNVAF